MFTSEFENSKKCWRFFLAKIVDYSKSVPRPDRSLVDELKMYCVFASRYRYFLNLNSTEVVPEAVDLLETHSEEIMRESPAGGPYYDAVKKVLSHVYNTRRVLSTSSRRADSDARRELLIKSCLSDQLPSDYDILDEIAMKKARQTAIGEIVAGFEYVGVLFALGIGGNANGFVAMKIWQAGIAASQQICMRQIALYYEMNDAGPSARQYWKAFFQWSQASVTESSEKANIVARSLMCCLYLQPALRCDSVIAKEVAKYQDLIITEARRFDIEAPVRVAINTEISIFLEDAEAVN